MGKRSRREENNDNTKFSKQEKANLETHVGDILKVVCKSACLKKYSKSYEMTGLIAITLDDDSSVLLSCKETITVPQAATASQETSDIQTGDSAGDNGGGDCASQSTPTDKKVSGFGIGKEDKKVPLTKKEPEDVLLSVVDDEPISMDSFMSRK